MLTQAIAIRTTPARISIHSENARIEIHNQAGELSITSGPAEMSITTQPLSLQIDSTVPRQELGYFDPLALLADMVSYTKSQVAKAIADRVAAGDAMAHIERGGNAIAALAQQNAMRDYSEHQFIVTLLPHTPPALRFTPGSVSTNIRARLAQVQFTARPPMISVTEGQRSVEVEPSSLRIFVRDPRTLDLTV
jgi:hypothetical protein